MKNVLGITALALSTGCLPDVEYIETEGPAINDFEAGSVIELQITATIPNGAPDCGLRPSWTWRYVPNYQLVADGPRPRDPKISLRYDAQTHSFIGEQHLPDDTYRSDEARLFQGQTFKYAAWWWDAEEHYCNTEWVGVVNALGRFPQ